jgi:two-component system, LytTR family, response regulator
LIRALIIDDEPLARQSLARMLGEHHDFEIAGEAANGFEALEKISDIKPDVAFLDIEMPGFNGFEVLDNLADPPHIVFATAYNEYAVRAFEANALDYLLKPIQPERVARCVERIRTALSLERPQPETYNKLLKDLWPQRTGPRTRIAVRRGKRIIVLPVAEVQRIDIEDKLTFVHTASERYLCDKTISQLEESLAESGFFRISRGDLVNLEAVRELVPWFSGTWRVKLRDGAELDVSRERARDLKALLGL